MPAKLEGQALHRARGGGSNGLARGHRPGEGDLARDRMGDERLAQVTLAGDDVE